MKIFADTGSIKEIEATYHHMFDDVRISNALIPSRRRVAKKPAVRNG